MECSNEHSHQPSHELIHENSHECSHEHSKAVASGQWSVASESTEAVASGQWSVASESAQEYKDQVRRASSLLKLSPGKRPRQCKHVKSNGEFCGSPALRGRSYCYFHLTNIGRRLRAGRNHARAQAKSPENAVVPLNLPPFEDADSIQISLMQVVDALLHNRIDSRRAGLVLYALQTASSNLARGANFECRSGAAVAGRYDDFEEDYELGEDVPGLKTDEAAEEKQTAEQEKEEIAETCARLEEAKKEVDAAERFETLEDGTQVFYCEPTVRFMCSILGPLAGAPMPACEEQRDERAAPSQRLELLRPVASSSSGEVPHIPNDGMCGAPDEKGSELAA